MKSTQKILIAGLILMVVLNICTLGFIVFKASGRGHHPGGKHGPGKFIGKRLNFTEEQEASLAKLRESHEQKMQALRERTDRIRKEHLKLIKVSPYDTVKANQLLMESGNCHAEMGKQMADHFLAIRALCTPEQLKDFNEFVDRVGEHMPGSHRGVWRHRHEGGPGF